MAPQARSWKMVCCFRPSHHVDGGLVQLQVRLLGDTAGHVELHTEQAIDPRINRPSEEIA